MKSKAFAVPAVVLILVVCMALPASAAMQLKLGTATGGMAVYYNNLDVNGAQPGVPDGIVSGYDENPTNVAYVRMQFGYTYDASQNVVAGNANGAAFQFDNTDLGGFSFNSVFSGQPVGLSQFGFDLQAPSPTYNPAGGVVIPDVYFADNVNDTVAGATLANQGQSAWAVNDYKEPSGPGAGGSIINSLLRGTGYTLNTLGSSYSDGRLTIQVAGTLYTDGLIHWYGPTISGSEGDNTTKLSTWGLYDYFTFEGTLVYDTDYNREGWDYDWNTYSGTLENGADQLDFYAGSLDIYAHVIPEPTTLLIWSVLGVLGAVACRRRK